MVSRINPPFIPRAIVTAAATLQEEEHTVVHTVDIDETETSKLHYPIFQEYSYHTIIATGPSRSISVMKAAKTIRTSNPAEACALPRHGAVVSLFLPLSHSPHLNRVAEP